MSSIYESIDRLYSQKEDITQPQWARELRDELQEIKVLLLELKDSQASKPAPKRVKSRDYFKFVETLREKLKRDIPNDIHPELHYQNRRIGINQRGLLYDKERSRVIPRAEAFAIYDYYYEHSDEIDKFIVA